jgi:hypothetical protein
MIVKKLGSRFGPNLSERVVRAFIEGKNSSKSKVSLNGVIFNSLKLVKTLNKFKCAALLIP